MNLQHPSGLRDYLLGTTPADPASPGRAQAGHWSVERTLLDRAAGTRGTFTGVVIFSPDGDGGLHFHEEGTVVWPSVKWPAGDLPAEQGDTFTGPATRDYLLRPADTPDAMDMLFPDGRPFHRMSFSPEASQDRHWCDPDTYRVTYECHGENEFSYVWDVTGPRKDLLLESVLRRLPEPPRPQTG
ncbi:hypothetical protein ARGLB_083_01660 [Arthrobacter globiformis NBRC 12137]|uniref:DUF6314 domain-containing protein n=1 Tax=Arthrobacter globiformis (strain ATCC 8010 / DSM 20124 / JCM 1332 / NBRC 12137 / NCIMB 8907 / NRRL B-2979 / 168) TaxID=1077972 RepID=H0QR23_ARTG1|nr:DUF6314 family protein [Arthrobacter globiformis]GAB15274.1 hypothetical protein ARGLB_083_01660 [Arthrobacter globiformis NBRC 12137]